MNLTDLLSLLTLLLYAVAFITAVAGLLARHPGVKRGALGLTVAGFALHCLILLAWQISPQVENVSRNVFLLPLAWCLVAVGLVMWWKWRLDVLLLFSPPLAFVLLFVSLVLHSADASLSQALSGPVFFLHIGAVSIGIGLIAVAAGAAVIFLWQEKSLKSKTPWAGFRKDLPALASLDRINAVATVVGFPFYSLGVLCGFVWARMTWGTLLSGDPKELLSLLIWCCYAGLFHQRLGHGWFGRKPAVLTLAIFTASMFSLFVVNTLFPTHHSFGS